MGLFDRHREQSPAQSGQPNARQGFQQMQQNPAAFFGQLGVNIPEGMSDPGQIINHLKTSGQIPGNVFNSAMQVFNRRPKK